MPNQKISQLASGTNAQAGDLFVIARGSNNFALTTAQLFNAPSATATFAALTVDTDTLFVDAANNRVGVGTASPSVALDVNGNIKAGSPALVQSRVTIDGNFESMDNKLQFVRVGMVADTAQFNMDYFSGAGGAIRPFTWIISGTERMRLDASGNLGLGVTPSAWNGYGAAAIQASSLTLVSANNLSALGTNWYFSGSQFVYTTTNAATSYRQLNGAHEWYTAPSGTAGNAITFTQAMTLDASGNLLVGKTATGVGVDGAQFLPAGFSGVSASGTTAFFVNRNTNDGTVLAIGRNGVTEATLGITSGALTFGVNSAERACIDANGLMGVGTASPSHRLHVSVAAGADRDIFIAGVAGASNGVRVLWDHASATIRLILSNLPTSSAGLAGGTVWNDSGTLKIA